MNISISRVQDLGMMRRDSSVPKASVKFQSDAIIVKPNLGTSLDILPLSERRPELTLQELGLLNQFPPFRYFPVLF